MKKTHALPSAKSAHSDDELGVVPEIMKAFRKDEIGLNEVAAYTLADDQERQRVVFKAMPRAASWQIKKALTEGNIPLSDIRLPAVAVVHERHIHCAASADRCFAIPSSS